eukprot:4741968-Alexandrium_andersonii.AAC.1
MPGRVAQLRARQGGTRQGEARQDKATPHNATQRCAGQSNATWHIAAHTQHSATKHRTAQR